MEDILKKAFNIELIQDETESVRKVMESLELNQKLLKRYLNKNERRLLLRLIDAKDLIAEEKGLHSFINGFKLGLKIGYETNKN